MNLHSAFKLITLIQDRNTSYNELVEFLYGETPPPDHNFLARTDLSTVAETIKSNSYDHITQFEENPNPNATVAFIIRFPFQYYIYKNIYRHLPKSEFIIDFPFLRTDAEKPYELLQKMTGFLKKEGVYFRTFRDYEGAEEFFKPYETLVTYFWIPIMRLPCNKDKKKIRVMYGHGKDLYNFGAWSRHFDCALTYGPYSSERIRLFTDVEETGNARFDDWFKRNIDAEEVQKIKKQLDHDKQTVLYLPTHGNLSSLEWVAGEIQTITEKYNLIIKPHPINLHFDTEKLKNFKKTIGKKTEQKILWVDDFFDNITLFSVSNAILSDNSGSIFDAVLADKPVVLIDHLAKDFFKNENWKIVRFLPNMMLIPGSFPESMDQKIKKDPKLMPGEIIKKPKQALSAISKTLQNKRQFSAAGRRIRAMLFSHADGTAGKRAAGAIRSMEKRTKYDSFLPLAMRAEDAYRETQLKESTSSLLSLAENYYNPSPFWNEKRGDDEIIFSVIIPCYNGAKKIRWSLGSIANQTGIDLNRIEIIVVDDGSKDDTKTVVRSFIDENNKTKILYLRLNENRGPAFARNIGIKHARGTFIAFTDDDAIVPDNWLATFRAAFKNNPEIAGVGGWYSTEQNESQSHFDRYIYWRNLPKILHTYKTIAPELIACGNTANVCFRKTILEKSGGFNIYFPHPSHEDGELQMRIQRKKFALMSHSHMVIHNRAHGLSSFIRYSIVRGWARFLTGKIHEDWPILYYKISFVNTVHFWGANLRKIITETDHTIPTSFTEKIILFIADCIYQTIILIGKYWIPLEILAKRNREQKNV